MVSLSSTSSSALTPASLNFLSENIYTIDGIPYSLIACRQLTTESTSYSYIEHDVKISDTMTYRFLSLNPPAVRIHHHDNLLRLPLYVAH